MPVDRLIRSRSSFRWRQRIRILFSLLHATWPNNATRRLATTTFRLELGIVCGVPRPLMALNAAINSAYGRKPLHDRLSEKGSLRGWSATLRVEFAKCPTRSAIIAAEASGMRWVSLKNMQRGSAQPGPTRLQQARFDQEFRCLVKSQEAMVCSPTVNIRKRFEKCKPRAGKNLLDKQAGSALLAYFRSYTCRLTKRQARVRNIIVPACWRWNFCVSGAVQLPRRVGSPARSRLVNLGRQAAEVSVSLEESDDGREGKTHNRRT
jgi:hypothetical protein